MVSNVNLQPPTARDGLPLLTFVDEERGELIGVSCFDTGCVENAAVGALAAVGVSAYGEFPHAISVSGPRGPALLTALFVQRGATEGLLRVATCADELCLDARVRTVGKGACGYGRDSARRRCSRLNISG